MKKPMKLVYWGGGIREDRIAGFKQFLDLMKREPSYHKIPDLRNPNALILGNLLEGMDGKELFGEDHASDFMQIAAPSINYEFESQTDTKTRKDHSATTFLRKIDPNNKFLPRYQKLAEQLSERSRVHYASAKRQLDKLGVPYFVVPGWDDTNQVLEVFEDKVLHAGTTSLEDRIVLGIGAIDGHESALPHRARIKSTTPAQNPNAEQQFLETDPEALRSNVLVTPYFIEDHYSNEVLGNKPVGGKPFGHVVNGFVKGIWFENRPKRQRRLIITSANHAGRHTEASPIAGGVVLNAGRNVTLGSHGAYCITLGPDGLEKIGAVYIRGNAHTVYKPSGETFPGDAPQTGHTTFVYNVKDAAKYPGANEKPIVDYVAPGGEFDRKVKHVKTQKIKCAEETDSLMQKITRVRKTQKATELALDESHRDFRALNREYKDLCNAYASLAYKFVERKQYTAGVEAYQESLDFAPERMTEMRAAILHNIGTVFENRNMPADAVAWYALAYEEMPQHRAMKESYAHAVNKLMKK
jgi:hypothetical protein